MRILITSGPTREPIDPVRYISNRSSGQMGAALAAAAIAKEHTTTIISGPVNTAYPGSAKLISIETTRQMYEAVMAQLPGHDVLIMAAAVADFRPKAVGQHKLTRDQGMTLELEPTEDIIAAAANARASNQLIVGFSLEAEGDIARAKAKLARKRLDLMVYNPLKTMNSVDVSATLLFADGTQRDLPPCSKPTFAQQLIGVIESLARR